MLPENVLLKESTIHFCCLIIIVPVGIFFLLPVLILWLVHVQNSFSNRTTYERFSRENRKRREEQATTMGNDSPSATTGQLARRIIMNVGKPKEVRGAFRCCKNIKLFYADSLVADCHYGSNDEVGYQEKIISELFSN